MTEMIEYELYFTYEADEDTVRILFKAQNDQVAKNLSEDFIFRLQLAAIPILYSKSTKLIVKEF